MGSQLQVPYGSLKPDVKHHLSAGGFSEPREREGGGAPLGIVHGAPASGFARAHRAPPTAGGYSEPGLDPGEREGGGAPLS